MNFHNRSDTLIELLEALTREGHEFVLVGGYAVSAFNTRFSTDLDIVVAPDSKAERADVPTPREVAESNVNLSHDKNRDGGPREWQFSLELGAEWLCRV